MGTDAALRSPGPFDNSWFFATVEKPVNNGWRTRILKRDKHVKEVSHEKE
jgi:hypothetical protein